MPGKTLDNVKPLGELNPDFVLSVKYAVDETGIPLQNADGKFATLIQTLKSAGFYSQVRPGEDSTLLLFVKLNDEVLLKALKSFHLKDYLYGVKNSIDDDEQILERLTTAEKLRVGYSLITDPKFEGGAGINPGSGDWEFVEKIIPLHDYELNKKLLDTWLKKPFVDENDIATIKDIAGEKVALYFGFLRFYSVWLIVPSVLGFLSFFFFKRYSIIFTFLNLFWAILFTNSWKKKENIYAITWNTKDSSLIESKRTDFVGDFEEVDNITGIKSPKFPSFKRSLRQLAFIPVAITFALILLSYQFGCFFIEIFLNEIYQGGGKSILSLVPTVLIVGFIPIITAGYTVFVDKFVAWENHETQTSYDRSVVQKQFVLNLLASYVPLLITSFVYLPFGHLVNPYLSFIHGYTNRYNISINQNHFEINKDRLNQQFAYFAVTNQVVGFFLENIVPVVLRKVFEHFRKSKDQNAAVALTDLPEEAKFLEQVRKQVTLPPFNVDDEYRELTIQFGYLALFGPVWSLAPIVSLINNWIEFRGDAYKLFNEASRPVPHKADSIDPWNKNLRGLTWFATLVAPAVTALFRQSDIVDSTSFSHLKSPVRLQPWSLLAIVLVTEHLAVAVNFIVESIHDKISSQRETEYESNLYKTRRQYIEGYVNQSSGQTGGLSKRSLSIDPTEQYWENFSDQEVVKHAGIIPKQILDAVAFKKEKEAAEKEQAKVLNEKKKAEAQQAKQFEQEKYQQEKLASNSAYQSHPEDSYSNLQSRSNRAPVDSTTASKGVPPTAASYSTNAPTSADRQGNGHGVGVAAATAAAVGGGSSLAAGQSGQQAGQQGLSKGIDAYSSHPSQSTGNASGATGNVPQINVNDTSTSKSAGPTSGSAPQTSQGYTAEYGTPGSGKVPSDASNQRSLDPASNKGSSSSGAGTTAAAGAGLAGAGAVLSAPGSGSSPSGANATSTSGAGKSTTAANDAVSEKSATSNPSTKSSNRKSGFFSKFSKKDASSIGKAAKDDGSKHLSQGKTVAGDLKKGDYSSSKKLASDVQSSPDEYVGNSKKAFNSSDYKTGGSNAGTSAGATSGSSTQNAQGSASGHGKAAGIGAGAAGVGAGVAGLSAHDSDKPSAPQGQVNSRQAATETSDVNASRNVDPQADNVNPYNAIPKDTQQSSSTDPSTKRGSHSHGKEAAGLGAGAGAAGLGAAAASGSGPSSTAEVPKEEKKGGFLSKFSRKDATSLGQAAKDDGSKHFAEGKNIAGDVRKGDYSSGKKFAGDVKSNPDEYIGNTKNAFNSSDYKSTDKSAGTATGAGIVTGTGVTGASSGSASGSGPSGSGVSADAIENARGPGDAPAAAVNARGPGDAPAAAQNAQGPNSSGYGKTAGIGAAVAATGAGIAGLAGHGGSKDTDDTRVNTAGSAAGQPSTSGTSAPSSSSGYKGDDVSGLASKSRDAPQSHTAATESHSHGRDATALGAGAGAAGLATSSASGSNATEASKEEKKGGFFSIFNKKDATSIAKAAKEDGTKLASEGKHVIEDARKGDYSSAKKLAGDIKDSPDEYIGNTKRAVNQAGQTETGAAGTSATGATGSAASAQDYTHGASQVPSDSASSDHGISGKHAATGAGVVGAGAAGAAYANRDHGSSSAGDKRASGYEDGSKPTVSSGSSVPATSGAGATLPPNHSSGHQNKSAAITSSTKSGHGSTTGYGGADSDVFANQPNEALKNSDAKGYTSSQAAEQGTSGKSQGASGAGVATGAALGAGAGKAYTAKSGSGSGSSQPDYSASGSHSDSGKPSSSSRFTDQGSSANPPSSKYVSKDTYAPEVTRNDASHTSHGEPSASTGATGAGVGARSAAAGAPSDLAAANRNPFTSGESSAQPSKPTAAGGPTLDPNSAAQSKSIDASFKPSKAPATDDSHPTSLGGAEKEHAKQSSGFGLGGVAAGVAGAAGAAGLANKLGASHGGENKEGSIPSGGQNVSSNLASDGEKAAQGGYLDQAKGYGEKYGSQLNEYVQQAAHKADEYARDSNNQYVTKGNEYVQLAADKSDEYAKQQAAKQAQEGATKSATDPSGSAGAAATKPSSGGKDSVAGSGLGTKGEAAAVGGATAGGLSASNAGGNSNKKTSTSTGSNKSSTSAYNQFSKEHSKAQEPQADEQSGSLPQHFQYENKNPYTGQTGPVPGTEDKVLDASGNPTSSSGAGVGAGVGSASATKASGNKYGDELAPPRTGADDVESASSTSSPKKKKSLLKTLKNKVKGTPSPESSAQASPKKTTA